MMEYWRQSHRQSDSSFETACLGEVRLQVAQVKPFLSANDCPAKLGQQKLTMKPQQGRLGRRGQYSPLSLLQEVSLP